MHTHKSFPVTFPLFLPSATLVRSMISLLSLCVDSYTDLLSCSVLHTQDRHFFSLPLPGHTLAATSRLLFFLYVSSSIHAVSIVRFTYSSSSSLGFILLQHVHTSTHAGSICIFLPSFSSSLSLPFLPIPKDTLPTIQPVLRLRSSRSATRWPSQPPPLLGPHPTAFAVVAVAAVAAAAPAAGAWSEGSPRPPPPPPPPASPPSLHAWALWA